MPPKDAAYFEGARPSPSWATRFTCFRAWSDRQPTAQCGVDGYMDN